MGEERVTIEGPWFEDLTVGQVFDDAPAVTITAGHTALHQALFADRLRLPLDAVLSRIVTGRDRQLVNPSLVCNVAIGQTTYASQRVRGNLFYRGLVLHRPVYVGDTLTTRTEVVALRQNRPKPGRDASGMAVLDMHVRNQEGDTVLRFWRCPMLPCRDPRAQTGHEDSFDSIPEELAPNDLDAAVPCDWKLDAFRDRIHGPHFADVEEGTSFVVGGRDTVTSAPELVRMTLNMATTHTDATSSVYRKRLVYGGHTISMAAAEIVRALPNLVTLLGWRSCDHTAPVFEGDILATEVTVTAKHARESGGLVDLHAVVNAERGPEAPEGTKNAAVLDWKLVALMA